LNFFAYEAQMVGSFMDISGKQSGELKDIAMDGTQLLERSGFINRIKARFVTSSFMRIAKYVLVRTVSSLLSVMLGLYLTILAINLGGYVDKVFESDVIDVIDGVVRSGAFRGTPPEAAAEQIWTLRWTLEEEKGLHVPFMLRTWRWFLKSLTFDWEQGDLDQTKIILQSLNPALYASLADLPHALIVDRLPYSLLLTGASVLLLFLTTIPLALAFSRRSSRFLNRLLPVLSSTTSAPAWIHGIILIFIFATMLKVLPYPRFTDDLLDLTRYDNLIYFLKSLILPILSIFLSLLFQSLYTWRAFFSIYSQEDYVELGRAQGLASDELERKYILRPTMPYVITSFAMIMLGLWQNLFALETLFQWPGLGEIMLAAITYFSTPLLISVVALFAYLMAITVILLDFFYAWIDPRVRVDFSPQAGSAARRKSALAWLRSPKMPSPMRRPLALNERRVLAPRLKVSFSQYWQVVKNALGSFEAALWQICCQPNGAIGLIILLIMLGVSIWAAFAYPSARVVKDWRDTNPHGVWYAVPKNALPAWVNFFRYEKLPETILLDSREGQAVKSASVVSPELTETTITFKFDYQYDKLPQGLTVYLYDQSQKKYALTHLIWITPDGREFDLGTVKLSSATKIFYLSRNELIQSSGKKSTAIEDLFAGMSTENGRAARGVYQLLVKGYLFEEGSDLDAEVVLHGQVYGLAGSDDLRRDLMLPLLAGLPVALAFGLLGAIATAVLAMFIAALGAWYGGWVDNLIQRISDVNMVIPSLAIAILVFLLYSNSIWVVLGTLVALSVFGSALKNYRAAFLQVTSSPYVEAAMSQGASDWRIIWKYLMPRIYPTVIPQIAVMVPVYVYYEVTLAFLGISNPALPTWGRAIYDAIQNQAFRYYPLRVFIPLALLFTLGFGFSLLGSALERVLNPRLREE
jgi:peptide/nickel transport system permease protein